MEIFNTTQSTIKINGETVFPNNSMVVPATLGTKLILTSKDGIVCLEFNGPKPTCTLETGGLSAKVISDRTTMIGNSK